MAHTLPALVGAWSAIPHHSFEARVGAPPGDLAALVTPFLVLAAAALALASLRARGRALAVACVAAILYVDGHGIHLAANSIGADSLLPHEAAARAYFFDERLGHIEWHLGWLGLLFSLVIAERTIAPVRLLWGVVTVALLAPVLGAVTVEGQTWWLVLAATPIFIGAALRRRSHVAVVSAAAVVVAAAGIGVWAAWWNGVPEITEVAAAATATGELAA